MFSLNLLKSRFLNRVILVCLLHFCFNYSDILMCLLHFHFENSLGSLWASLGAFWGVFSVPLGSLWTLWGSFRSLWAPLGYFGITLAVLGSLGHYFGGL